MSVRARLDRLEAAMPVREVDEDDVVIVVCDLHGPGCRGDAADHDFVFVRVVDKTVFDPPEDRSELIAQIRRTVLRPGPTIH